ncbi:hypothetical protein [Flavobacterium sp.]|uniref:hypothetical protein n=1 Tax=Flavobacterium sp. TaxID=239 RepID=UPI0037539012
MANTISDENEVVKANNIAEIENLKVFKTSPLECLAGKLTVYNQAIGYGMSSDEASTYAYRYYFRCMGEVF